MRDDGSFVTTITLRPDFSENFIDAYMESGAKSIGEFVEKLFNDNYRDEITMTRQFVKDMESFIKDYKLKAEES